jgi:hypothetical protein
MRTEDVFRSFQPNLDALHQIAHAEKDRPGAADRFRRRSRTRHAPRRPLARPRACRGPGGLHCPNRESYDLERLAKVADSCSSST